MPLSSRSLLHTSSSRSILLQHLTPVNKASQPPRIQASVFLADACNPRPLNRQVCGIFGEIRAGKGVAPGAEPPPEIRFVASLGGRLLQASPQLVQERRPLSVGDHLEFCGYGRVYELAPGPGRGVRSVRWGGEGALDLVREAISTPRRLGIALYSKVGSIPGRLIAPCPASLLRPAKLSCGTPRQAFRPCPERPPHHFQPLESGRTRSG